VDSVIAVLPAHVIDQIAAGEVIERPASVVKELVDNALDAGAKQISIETVGGGRQVVRVTDDGSGMGPKDALLALERHATSKLRQLDDLWGIESMGFRGEALAAISSVARMTLTTRRSADLAATRVTVEASRLVAVVECGAATGTTIEVVDLLHNLPARLKFMKGEATEASHITDLVAKLAMAHPTVHFRLKHNGRTALELPPDRDGFARAQALLGPRVAQRLVTAKGEEAGLRVTAYLAAPDLAQTTARGVQLFVGRRPVRDRGLLHAVTMGYGELIPRGRYPVAVVLLEAPAGAVDVNVHPQKHEVRFADANAVAAAVRHVVQSGVATASWRAESGLQQVQMVASIAAPALPLDGQPATALSERYARELRRSMGARARGQGSLFERNRSRDAAFAETVADRRSTEPPFDLAAFDLEPAPDATDRNDPARAWAADIQNKARAQRAAERRAELRATVPDGSALSQQPFASDEELARGLDAPKEIADGSGRVDAAQSTPGYFSRLRYLGQLDLTYLVCETEGELVLVDQHAAHERVELARLLAKHTARDVATQRMLFPVTIDATPAQLALIARVADVLASVGYEAEAFGKATIAIKAVPAGIRHGDPAQLLRRMLADWERDGTPAEEERVARVLAEIACHSVVRAGDRLLAGEAEALLRSLDDVDPTTPAPHGRALLLRLPLNEIGRRFGR
jgi:DNA mismatch repair protein MutL